MENPANSITPSLVVDGDEDAQTRVYRPEVHGKRPTPEARVARTSLPVPPSARPSGVPSARPSATVSKSPAQPTSEIPRINPKFEEREGDETKIFRPPPELIQAAGAADVDKPTEVQQVSKELIYAAREARAQKRRDRGSPSSPVPALPSVHPVSSRPTAPVVEDIVDFRSRGSRGIVYAVWLLAALLGVGLIALAMAGY